MPSVYEVSSTKEIPTVPAKEAKLWKKTSYELPPCKVCGRKGTGFHYGVNTCEPCKVFFRQGQTQSAKFVCKQDARCNLFLGRRNMCSHCRYQRCLQVGMSREGIKNGRYSAGKKMQDITELRQQKTLEVQLSAILDEERLRPSVEKFVSKIHDARANHAYIWDQLQKDSCFRTLSHVKNKGATLTHTMETGELQVINKDLEDTTVIARQMIKFIKCLPGFRDLCIEDQVALFQDSLFDVIRINMYDVARDMADSRVFSVEEVKMIFGTDMGTRVVQVCYRLLHLQLKPEEVAVIGALLLFNTYGCTLKEPQKVEALHQQLVDALQWLLKRNHPEDKLIFPKVVAAMTEMRSLTSLTIGYHRTMCELADKDTGVRVSPLLRQLVPPVE